MTRYAYDGMDRLTHVEYPGGRVVDYAVVSGEMSWEEAKPLVIGNAVSLVGGMVAGGAAKAVGSSAKLHANEATYLRTVTGGVYLVSEADALATDWANLASAVKTGVILIDVGSLYMSGQSYPSDSTGQTRVPEP